MEKIIPVILCGGSGTRLWPLSRRDEPKQFLPLLDERDSLFQQTARRALRVAGCAPSEIVTVALDSLAERALAQLAAIDAELCGGLLREPEGRDTAASFALAALHIRRRFGEGSLMLVMPSDHKIEDENAFQRAIRGAHAAAQEGRLVSFGARPTRAAETGYGYIAIGRLLPNGQACDAIRFIEKPDETYARELTASRDYLWSMGIHLFRVDALLRQYALHAPATLRGAEGYFENPHRRGLYAALKRENFEKAVLEKTAWRAVVPCEAGWTDIGSWESLWRAQKRDEHGNAVLGDAGRALLHRAENSILRAHDRLLVAVGVKNLAIIDTADALLVADKSCGESLKIMAATLQKMNAREALEPAVRAYEWGKEEALPARNGARLVSLEIMPGTLCARVSENGGALVIVAGNGKIDLEGKTRGLAPMDCAALAPGAAYEIYNDGEDILIAHEYAALREEESAELKMAAAE